MHYGAPAHTPRDIEKLIVQGFDFAELAMPNVASRRRWWESGVKNAHPNGFFLIAHGPIMDEDPADLGHLRAHYLPGLFASVDAAFRIGARYLTVHLTISRSVVGESVATAKIQALKELVEYGRSRDVEIGLENVHEDAADLEPAFPAIPDLSLTLDAGHAQLGVEANRAFDIITKFGRSIRHTHIHDNRGGPGHKLDLHLPVGEGRVDFPGVLAALMSAGYDGTMTIEVKEAARMESRRRIRGMLQDIRRAGETPAS
jgi:sugar phosphate isomerase/epimerase